MEPDPPERRPACEVYPCFVACGQRVAIAPVEPGFGFSSAGSIPWGIRGVNTLADDRLLTLNMQAAEVRSASDFGVLSRVPLPGRAFNSAVGDGWALVQAEAAALALLDAASPEEPRVKSWWFNAGEALPHLWLLGAVDGRFVVRNSAGVSFLDVSAEGAEEAFCLEQPEGAEWSSVELFGDVLAVATFEEVSTAQLYRVNAAGLTEWASFRIEQELPFVGVGDRLALASDVNRRLTLYDLSGNEPEEVAEVDGLPQYSDRGMLGGFLFRGQEDEVAYDLRGQLEAYDPESIPGADCLVRVHSRSSDASFIVSPLLPDQRLPAEPVPDVTCPVLFSYQEAYLGALSPDGNTLLLGSGYASSWIFRDLETGEERAVPYQLPSQWVHWLGDRLVMGRNSGGDFGLTVRSELFVSSPAAPETALTSANTPGPIIEVRATDREIWGLGYASNYALGEAQPPARSLWRFDPTGDAPAPVILDVPVDDVQTLELSDDRVYLVSPNALHVIDHDGATLGQFALPAKSTSSAASELGFFTTDLADRLWRLAPDAPAFTQIVDACTGCRLRGADATRVYVTSTLPAFARHPTTADWDAYFTYSDLLAYEPQTEGGAVLAGRHHIPPMLGNLLVDAKRLAALTGTVVVLEADAP